MSALSVRLSLTTIWHHVSNTSVLHYMIGSRWCWSIAGLGSALQLRCCSGQQHPRVLPRTRDDCLVVCRDINHKKIHLCLTCSLVCPFGFATGLGMHLYPPLFAVIDGVNDTTFKLSAGRTVCVGNLKSQIGLLLRLNDCFEVLCSHSRHGRHDSCCVGQLKLEY